MKAMQNGSRRQQISRWTVALMVGLWLSAAAQAQIDSDLARADDLISRDPEAALALAESLATQTPDQAVERAVIMARSQLFLGQTEAASAALATVSNLLTAVDPSAHSRWLRTEATTAFTLGQSDASVDAADQALALINEHGSPSEQVEALSVALQVRMGIDDYTEALGLAARLQALLSDFEIKPIIRFDAHMMLGVLHAEFLDFERAREAHEQAAAIAAEAQLGLAEGDARYALVQILNDQEELDAVRAELDRLEALYGDADDAFGLSMVTLERSYLALGEEDWEAARELAQQAAQAFDSLSVPTLATLAYPIQAKALLELGRPAEAERVLEQMRATYPDLPDLPVNDAMNARIYAAQGRWQAAFESAQAQLELEREDAERRLSQSSERARARLDFETARLQRSELEAELRVRELQIEAAQRQAFWQRATLLLAFGVLALAGLVLYRLRRHGKQLSELALRDALTNLPNRRAFFHRSARLLHEAQLTDQPISVMMIDLDHFKEINDEHGHGVGDQVLADFAALLRRVARGSDVPARIGGEEFALLLPGTDRQGALLLAERLLIALAEAKRVVDLPLKPLTASIGVASRKEEEDIESLMKQADSALYQAKREGRARAIAAEGRSES
ncbi:MAG: diguanylate cyclase [Pseudomonadota bacterium]